MMLRRVIAIATPVLLLLPCIVGLAPYVHPRAPIVPNIAPYSNATASLARRSARPVPGASLPLDPRQKEGWDLQIEYAGHTFFDGWDFFSEPDPSWGFVNYVTRPKAFAEGVAFWTQDGTPGIQADHWTHLKPTELRDSVRITTKQLFDGGLIILDARLMPWGCGVWPAFWTLGYNATWPDAGEIDIVEGIQAMRHNQMTVHTKPGCTVDQSPGQFSGALGNPACDRAGGGTGCSITSSVQDSYGEHFNANGGGVYAMLWDDAGIKMWNWPRAVVPQDIGEHDPQPQNWGIPVAAWGAGTCDPKEYFQPQTLVLNVNLCGEWAGQVYNEYEYCPGSCADHIANPDNLNNTIWLINSIRVYQRPGYKPIPQQAPTNRNLTGSPGPQGSRLPPEIVSGAKASSSSVWAVPALAASLGLAIFAGMM